MTLFYHHPLKLSFDSAQTIQVLRDYGYLSDLGVDVVLYGYWSDEKDLGDIAFFLKKHPRVKLLHTRKSLLGSIKLKILFYSKLMRSRNPIIVTRHLKRLKHTVFYKSIFKKALSIHEMHEESFGYLFKKNVKKKDFQILLEKTDLVIFTNDSQRKLYVEEFSGNPDFLYVVLPNGVELSNFKKAKLEKNFVITYTGQFNSWKNTELLFQTLKKLPKKFHLRIAGGKKDGTSQPYIDEMVKKYGLQNRVDYLGFLSQDEMVEKAIDKSHILFLPLGDNIQSTHLTSPMKLFEYMATQIPVLAIDFPSITSIASENEIFLTPSNPEACAHTIQKIAHLPDETIQKKIENMNRKAQEYSYENRSKRYFDYLKKIIEYKS
ncbi:glycosyltransferase family 4 protein [Hydrogenimonas sp.]